MVRHQYGAAALRALQRILEHGTRPAGLATEAEQPAEDHLGVRVLSAGVGSRKHLDRLLCWRLALGNPEDRREQPQTRGRRPFGQDVVNTYVDRLLRAAAVDERVNAAFSQVQQLVAPPSTLFAPGVVAAVLRSGRPVEPAGSDGPLRPFEAVAPRQARQPSGG